MPLKQNKDTELDLFTSLFEIPRGTTAKMEVATKEQYNPIKQDVKVDKSTGKPFLREYMLNPCFNYGIIPQTWENNEHKDRETGAFGDNDPLDLVEIGMKKVAKLGDIEEVKVLGALCLLD